MEHDVMSDAERRHYERFGKYPDAECWLHPCEFSGSPVAVEASKYHFAKTVAAVQERDRIISEAVTACSTVHGRGLHGREVADFLAGRIAELETALRNVLLNTPATTDSSVRSLEAARRILEGG
jgi:hypothetical protein